MDCQLDFELDKGLYILEIRTLSSSMSCGTTLTNENVHTCCPKPFATLVKMSALYTAEKNYYKL